VRLLPHPEPRAQASRRVVARVEPGGDAMQIELIEGQVHHCVGGLCCVTPATVDRVEHPAQLTATMLAAVEHEDHVADQ
jgi:hypothetical protein